MGASCTPLACKLSFSIFESSSNMMTIPAFFALFCVTYFGFVMSCLPVFCMRLRLRVSGLSPEKLRFASNAFHNFPAGRKSTWFCCGMEFKFPHGH